MPFYLRKSVSAGPFRFNFSKSGVGASVGIKGLRIGTGPRGHYIRAGRGAIQYQGSLGHAGAKKARRGVASSMPRSSPAILSGVEMIEVDSGSVLEMRDEAFGAVLDDINAASKKSRLAVVLPALVVIISFVAAYLAGSDALGLGVLAFPAWGLGLWVDSYRRAAVLHYDLIDGAEGSFQRITEAFDALMGCGGKWHIEAGGAVRDITTWKRNAGASHIVRRKTTTLDYKLPAVVKSNVTPPALHVGRQIIFFFPDVALIQDGDRFGAVGYADLRLACQHSNFVEEERVPKDAQIVSYTWEHPNKSGGPDRRFKVNRQLPVCLYEAMHLSSKTGVNELVEFSRTGVAKDFASALAFLPKQSVSNALLPLPAQ